MNKRTAKLIRNHASNILKGERGETRAYKVARLYRVLKRDWNRTPRHRRAALRVRVMEFAKAS